MGRRRREERQRQESTSRAASVDGIRFGRRAKVPSSQLMFVLCLYNKHTTQVQPHTCSISTLTRLPSHKSFALWTHSRITPESQVSSFESSLSEEQMRGRRRFCRKCATPRRSRIYLGLVHRELAIGTIGYVLVPRGTSVLIISPGSTQPYDRGSTALVLLLTADRSFNCSAACITSRTNSFSRTIRVMFFTIPADLSVAVKMR